MIINNFDDISTPDFTIIGAGPASITLALELEKKGKSVLILEAGSRYYEEKSQEFYKGEIFGDDYFELDHCRLRFLGGGTGHYNGRLHPYDELDFKEWPIKKKDLDPFANKTNEIFEIKKDFYESSSLLKNFYLASHIVSPIRFGEKYYNNLEKSKKIFLHFNAPVLLIEQSTENENKVGSLIVYSNKSKKKIKVNNLILACGGIENSRLLLWSRNNSKTNFLKETPIGNYWMEHPSGSVGHFIGEKNKLVEVFNNQLETHNLYLVPNPEFVKKKNINNARILIYLNPEKNFLSKSFKLHVKDLLCVAPVYGKKIVESLQKNLMLHCNATVQIQSEMKPDFENRLILSKNKSDAHGIPRIELHWKVREDFFDSSNTILSELGKEFIKLDVGRIGIDRFIFDKTLENIQTYRGNTPYSKFIRTYHTSNVFGGYHHMGGTRMGKNKTDSVVDSNLKVHGLDNFYIAGSSVFPTGGHWNPTYTIVQMSLRLAEYLNS